MSQYGNKRKKGVGTALLDTSLAGSAMGGSYKWLCKCYAWK